MRCAQTNLSSNHQRFEPCPNEGTEILWCPTWMSAGKGPMPICREHAKNFKPEHNKNVQPDAEFYWGQAALDAFERIGCDRQTKSFGIMSIDTPDQKCLFFYPTITEDGRRLTRCRECGRLESEHDTRHLGRDI